MNVAAFVLLAAMLAAYVMLDGWDLGVGTIHLFLGRNDRERAASFAAIAPFWNGNEVVLIAAGATLFAIFPRAYAVSFSGFYLPFIIVLWLLMVRGMAMELRGHFSVQIWRDFWDVAFSASSALLSILLGLALGNIVRGVPLDRGGYFTGTFAFLLNGYAVAVGALALSALAMHGAAYAALRLDDALAQRARHIAGHAWTAVLVLFAGVSIATFRVHPAAPGVAPWIAPAITAGSFVWIRWARSDLLRFSATSLFLLALVATAAQTLFPFLLPAFPLGAGGLDIYNSAPAGNSVVTGFAAAIVGCAGALVYGTITARRILAAGLQNDGTAQLPANAIGAGLPKK